MVSTQVKRIESGWGVPQHITADFDCGSWIWRQADHVIVNRLEHNLRAIGAASATTRELVSASRGKVYCEVFSRVVRQHDSSLASIDSQIDYSTDTKAARSQGGCHEKPALLPVVT